MRLTRYSDYTLRTCLYLAAHPDRYVPISEIADAYDIPRSNIMKLANQLVVTGFFHSQRGRHGGIRLAVGPHEVSIGDILLKTEGCEAMVDCANCRIKSACQLTGILREAQMAFYNVLKSYTLADAMAASPGLEDILAARSFSKVMAE